MSRAVVTPLDGDNQPELSKRVSTMLSRAARRFMARTKVRSSPLTFSASATATSFADTTAMARIAASTVIDLPACSHSLEGGCHTPRRVITTMSPGRSSPEEMASRGRTARLDLA